MRRFIKEELLFTIFLIALFLVLAVLSIVLIEGERRRNVILLEYEAERLASALFESYQGNGYLDDRAFGDEVAGFGIYRPSGQAVVNSGSAPSYFESPGADLKSVIFQFNRENDSLVLIRKLGFFSERMPMMRMHGMMSRRMGPSQFLFLEVNTKGYWAKQRLYRLGLLVVPFFIALITVLVGYFYRKNSIYRKKIESQRHLVKLGEIARTLSHEIKNPLSAIRIQTGILKKELPGEKIKDLRIIEEEVRRLSLLTDRIGEFLRNPLGKPEAIDLDRFLQNLILRFYGEIEYDNLSDSGILILFDRERLRSVLENLIKNAVESNDAGNRVEVRLNHTRSWVEISILDRGAGIPPDLQEKIFDPFFTSKIKGSGIGLSISKRFVEAAGGKLALSSRQGGGTEAVITLKRET